MDFKIHTLANGLQVLIGKTVGLSQASCDLWIRTGSIQEDDNERGSAHLLEHMIFKGTKDQIPKEYSSIVTELGGRDGAWTSWDATSFSIELPKENLFKAISLMANTIFNAAIDPVEFKKEKEVVLEELRMSLDNPKSWLGKHLFSKLFRNSYLQHPVLGYEDTLCKLKRNQLYKFYRTWFVPNNTFLVITCDLEEELLLNHINNVFSPLKPSQINLKPNLPEDVYGDSEIYKTPKDIQNLYVYGAMLCDGYFDTSKLITSDLLISVLSGSFCSRLHQRLVERDHISTSVNLFSLYIPPNPIVIWMADSEEYKNAQKIIDVVTEELESIVKNGINKEEFDRVQTSMLSELAEIREASEVYADWLGDKLFHYQLPSNADNYRRLILNQTPDDIQKLAAELFTPNRRWVYDIVYPNNTKCKVKLPKASTSLSKPSKELANTSEVKQDKVNNLSICYRNTPFTDTVAVFIAIPGVFEFEPKPGLSNLLSQTLAKGTSKYNALQISQKLELISAGLDISLGHSALYIKVNVLADKFLPTLDVLHEIIKFANYPEHELEIGRWQIEAERKSLLDLPRILAKIKATQSVFPNYRLGKDLLGPLNATSNYKTNQIRNYHKIIFENSPIFISVVGNLNDIDLWKEKIIATFSQNNNPLKTEQYPKIDMVFGKNNHTEMDKEQLNLVVCYPSVSLKHPDHLKATLFTEILGGISMSSRLFSQLRDKESLAYYVSASRIADDNCGIWSISISTEHKKYKKALDGILREMNKLCKEGPNQEEFDLFQRFLIYQIECAAETNSEKASRLTYQQIYGLPLDYYQQLLKELKNLTLKEFSSYCRSINSEEFSITTIGKRAES